MVVQWGEWVRRGPTSYRRNCKPAAFPVDPDPGWPPSGSRRCGHLRRPSPLGEDPRPRGASAASTRLDRGPGASSARPRPGEARLGPSHGAAGARRGAKRAAASRRTRGRAGLDLQSTAPSATASACRSRLRLPPRPLRICRPRRAAADVVVGRRVRPSSATPGAGAIANLADLEADRRVGPERDREREGAEGRLSRWPTATATSTCRSSTRDRDEVVARARAAGVARWWSWAAWTGPGPRARCGWPRRSASRPRPGSTRTRPGWPTRPPRTSCAGWPARAGSPRSARSASTSTTTTRPATCSVRCSGARSGWRGRWACPSSSTRARPTARRPTSSSRRARRRSAA